MSHDTTTIDGYLATLAEELGEPAPTPDEIRELLDVARHAAHRSRRQAAPLACWIAGRSGRPVREVLELVESDARLCEPDEDADAPVGA